MAVANNPGQAVTVEPTPTGQTAPLVTRPNRWRTRLQGVRRLFQNKKATFGATILIIFILTALFAPVIAPGDPTDYVARPHQPPSSEYWFGTTGQGQDVFSQTVWGTRISLGIGLLVGFMTTVIGAVVGISAGYFGKRVDDVLSTIMNVFLIIPSLPLLVTLAAFLPPGPVTIIMVLTFTAWAWPARVLRSQTLSLREKDFVSAAEVSGENRFRIMFREILPNMMSLAVAGMFGSVIYAIGAEAGLEFLGLGNVSMVTWGTNLYWATNNAGLITGAWWTFVPAGLAIALVAFSFAMVNFAMDEITNPRLRAHGESTNVLKQRSLRLSRGRATPVLKRAG